MAMLVGQAELDDLEMVSKVLKYGSSELMNEVSEHTGRVAGEVSASVLSEALQHNHTLHHTRALSTYAKRLLDSTNPKHIL